MTPSRNSAYRRRSRNARSAYALRSDAPTGPGCPACGSDTDAGWHASCVRWAGDRFRAGPSQDRKGGRPPPGAVGRHHAGGALHPAVVHVMRELDIDISDRVPRQLARELAERADVVVTMGCGDQCPYIPGKRYIDWDLQDPKDRPLDQVRATRDDITRRVEALVAELDHRE